ncbi:MAG: zinc-dependent metalloprotease family protein [Acidobacteriota bacterium]
MDRRLATGLVCSLTIVLGAGAAFGSPRGTVPEKIRYFERVATPVSAAPFEAGRGGSDRSFSIQMFGREFDLRLEPNDLFEPGARNLWIGRDGTRSEEPKPMFYRGVVAGDAGSWIRVSLTGSVLDGLIRTNDDVYFVEPAARYFTGEDAKGMVAYRLSDTESDWDAGSCALDDPDVAARLTVGDHSRSGAAGHHANHSFAPMSALTTYKRCQLVVVGDYELYLAKGSGAISYMQNIINQVDGIYRSELGVALSISQSIAYTISGDPFTSSTNPETLLDDASAFHSTYGYGTYGADLTHLFTGRDLDGSTIGIAWIDVLCHTYYGAGLSQAYSTDNRSLVLLTAHELGHNFSAYHDNQGGSPCAGTPFGYIMNPWVSTSLAYQFSVCSLSYVQPAVASASCFDTVTVSGNDAPVANAGSDQSVGVGAGVTLNGAGSYDPNGDPIAYSWAQIGGMAVALAGASSSAASFTAPGVSGTLTFRLTVSDGSLTSSDDVSVNVAATPSGAPVISSITSRRGRPGSPATVRGSGFSYDASRIQVYVGGYHARVTSATPTSIGIRIPRSLRRRSTVPVYVVVDGTWSDPYFFTLR